MWRALGRKLVGRRQMRRRDFSVARRLPEASFVEFRHPSDGWQDGFAISRRALAHGLERGKPDASAYRLISIEVGTQLTVKSSK